MEPITEFRGPTSKDYANVKALNAAFIRASFSLKPPQRARLAAAPFLLFSLREQQLGWWDEALAPQADLTAAAELDDLRLLRVQTAALCFLWHLSSRNPYATRIISGAALPWCEKITELPLVELLERVARRGDLLQSRLDTALADRLLASGTSARRRVRRSSQLAALQTLLTHASGDDHARLPSAARHLSRPLRVWDKKL